MPKRLGGLEAIEVTDEDGYRSIWQKRSGRLSPIKRSRCGRPIKVLPETVYRAHLNAVLWHQKETRSASTWSEKLAPAAEQFARRHPND